LPVATVTSKLGDCICLTRFQRLELGVDRGVFLGDGGFLLVLQRLGDSLELGAPLFRHCLDLRRVGRFVRRLPLAAPLGLGLALPAKFDDRVFSTWIVSAAQSGLVAPRPSAQSNIRVLSIVIVL
jgi:hypothetical protein